MEQLPSAAIAAMAATRRRVPARPPFECIALLLQGGGALGSYQAGVYAALAEAELQPPRLMAPWFVPAGGAGATS